MKRNTPFFSVTDRSKDSSIIMETETNIHFETLVRGEGEVDETREEFVERVCMRLDYLNR